MNSLKFAYSQEQLRHLSHFILERAVVLGATDASVEISEGIDTSINTLNSEIQHFETSYSSAIALSVYLDHNRGSVSQSNIQLDNIDDLIRHALSLAKCVKPDPYNGIADKSWLCQNLTSDLGLYNPIDIPHQELVARTKHIEQLRFKSNQIKSSDGATLATSNYNFVLANSNGFNQGYQTTRYATSISLIGENAHGMQTDYWSDSSRSYYELDADENLVDTAIHRITRRLNHSTITSGTYSVIFEAPIAKSIIANYLAAVSGHNLFRRLSFLTDSLNTKIFPDWMQISEDPFILGGNSSCYFDNEGVRVSARNLVTNGYVSSYILNCYTARKLGMQSTGNSGGCHNVVVSNNFDGDLEQLTKQLVNGLIVIETIGHGVNLVTGDYSVGASGLLVQNGEVQGFVNNLTIAGNLKNIYNDIRYIANDINLHSSIRCGSMLVDNISVST